MNTIKPALPRGTRDFPPDVMVKRNFILNIIRAAFEKYGFLPLETPAMENLSVLSGKYGDEGDQLLFKILNSGDFMAKVDNDEKTFLDYGKLTPQISEKGLRYDLTVPFARYVAMNQHDIVFPFKRYQIQPVWRADRPQKGRYREFFQCDADVIGTDSLLCEAEIAILVHEVFHNLGLRDYVLKVNNRKILEGIAESAGDKKRAGEFFVLLDKLDKIGLHHLKELLEENRFHRDFIARIERIITLTGDHQHKLDFLERNMSGSEMAREGVGEIRKFFEYLESLEDGIKQTELDISLARGLSYYTGMILEVKATGVRIGSIGGGGRYDNLAGVFGLPGMSGVGFSFGIDRIFDVMEELNLFSDHNLPATKILITNFDPETEKYAFQILSKLRRADIRAELFPDPVKIKKQLNYANKREIPFVLMIGSEELKKGVCSLKDMNRGEQEELTIDALIEKMNRI
ncbi:MAG: histidine--tRNA ligase [Cyclobacteriaceae bacterium]|nr:histidine--tRNA ligase [Cyclobacteriaceae bacterium]